MRLSFSIFTLLATALLLSSVSDLYGQRRSDYRKLSMEGQRPSSFFDFITLPGKNGKEVTFASIYSFSYRSLPFKKANDAQSKSGNSFISSITLNMEVFKSGPEQLKEKGRDISVKGLESAARAFANDTAYADTYEQSQSDLNFLQGQLDVSLRPGIYSFVLQLARGERSEPRMSKTQTLRIQSYEDMEVGNVLLGEKPSGKNTAAPNTFELISMGDNVRYGQDFRALAYIPDYNSTQKYTVSISALNATQDDTTKTGQVYSESISADKISTNLRPALGSRNQKNILRLNSSTNGFAYALLTIPNSRFPNDLYRLEVKEEKTGKTVSQTVFQSMWIDMPRSLLSLDFATKMLHYIVSQETIDRLSKGNRAEREQKFRSFWKKKDPTPKTEYNELMAEYYRRIDYAYQNFSSSTQPGFETDQGRIYITYGPPRDKERKFPTSGSTVEIWTYPNKEFIFRATSGFGDFKLVSEQNR
ncbi:MAG TPA: GWxTD domain-containing protein [Fodinibius sp.]|nr:GWxTD domain-containing protein [Fodinibius sp.]